MNRTNLSSLWDQGKVQGRNERSCSCPQCGGRYRFRIWLTPFLRGWCRECGYFATDEDTLPEDILVNYAKEELKPLTSISPDAHLRYFYELKAHPEKRAYWYEELGGAGMTVPINVAIERFKLGWCQSHPLASNHESYTIPYLDDHELCSYIQHRLIGAKMRYLPEASDMGLPPLWNSTTLRLKKTYGQPLTMWITVGVKKALSLYIHGYHNVVSMYCAEYLVSGGRSKFRVDEAIKQLRPFKILFLPDPGEESVIVKSVKKHSLNARVFKLVEKVDDYLRVDPVRIEEVRQLLIAGRSELGEEITI